MGTDIYGAIEVRDLIRAAALDDLPGAAAPHETPWVHGIDLYPLYPGGDYSPLGCLFGIRNWNGWEPVAEGRGLPADVSEVSARTTNTSRKSMRRSAAAPGCPGPNYATST